MKKENEKDLVQRKGKNTSEKRLVTGIIVIAVGIGFFFAPPLYFAFGLGILAGIVISEIRGMSNKKYLPLSMVFIAYLCISLILFYHLRFGEDGRLWLLLILVGIGIFDSTAHFVGKRLGRHKILPTISPGKTIEGTIAGFGACLVATGFIGRFLSFDFYQIIIAGVVLATSTFFGDALESWFKRKMQVKDSGTLLKGHGGLLDRIDSALMAIYGAYLVQYLFSLIG